MSASVGLRLQLMMDHEDNYQEMKAARSWSVAYCVIMAGGKKIRIFPGASTSAASDGQLLCPPYSSKDNIPN